MNDLTPSGAHLTDRLPELVNHLEPWTDDDRIHLAACVQCQAELDLLQQALGLGADLRPVQAPDALLPQLHARLAASRRPARRRRFAALVGLAAAAALLFVVVARNPARDGQPPDSEVAALIPLPELEGMTEQELQLVLEAMDDTLHLTPLTEQWVPDAPGDAELARLLGAEES